MPFYMHNEATIVAMAYEYERLGKWKRDGMAGT